MGLSDTITATTRAANIKAYKADHPNTSQDEISRLFGISKSQVSKILHNKIKSIRDNNWTAMRELVLMKRHDAFRNGKQYGAYSAAADLLRAGYAMDELPAENTIDKWIQHHAPGTKVAKVSAISSNRLQYWSERRPEQPNERGLIDTASTTIADTNITIMLYIDWYSRAAHVELVGRTFARYLPWFLGRSFKATGGPPRTIQTDNGFGFILTSHRQGLSKAMEYAVDEGIQRWEYVPVAEAFRNGKVERLVQTVKEYLEHTEWRSVNEARIALHQWLIDYNTIRPNKGICTRRKGGWNSPANVSNYHILDLDHARVIRSKGKRHDWEVVYKRFVASGVAYINAPECLIPVSNQLTGRYVDIVIRSKDMFHGSIEYTESIDHELTTHTIGTFEQLAPIVHVTHHQHPQFKPIPANEYALLKSQLKHLKTKRPRPGWVLPGIKRVDVEHGWQLRDAETDELMYDSRFSGDVDHLQEFAQ